MKSIAAATTPSDPIRQQGELPAALPKERSLFGEALTDARKTRQNPEQGIEQAPQTIELAAEALAEPTLPDESLFGLAAAAFSGVLVVGDQRDQAGANGGSAPVAETARTAKQSSASRAETLLMGMELAAGDGTQSSDDARSDTTGVGRDKSGTQQRASSRRKSGHVAPRRALRRCSARCSSCDASESI
ncbi:MAG: hypothetical protein HC779_07005 [Phyllobacteriaceae bacterium]|nr:hypothetical protein [Phyllobacteriaceae bacterium]